MDDRPDIPEHLRPRADRVVRRHDETDSTAEATRLPDGSIQSESVGDDGAAVLIVMDPEGNLRSEMRRYVLPGGDLRFERFTYEPDGVKSKYEEWLRDNEHGFELVSRSIDYSLADNSESRILVVTRTTPIHGVIEYESAAMKRRARVEVLDNGQVRVTRFSQDDDGNSLGQVYTFTIRQKNKVAYEIDDIVDRIDTFVETPTELSSGMTSTERAGSWKQVLRVVDVGPVKAVFDYQKMPPLWKWPTVKVSIEDRRIAFGWRYYGLGIYLMRRSTTFTPDQET